MPTSLPQHEDSSAQLSLSESDVTRLLNEDAPQVRVDVMHSIAEGYEQSHYSTQQAEIAEQIFRTLVRDTEKSVRLALSERFCDSDLIAKDIIHKLAGDEDDDIAAPVMAASPLLSDRDLLAIIEKTPTLSRLLAISRREHVSEPISTALINTEEATVVSSLLENDGADIAQTSYERIIDTHADNESLLTTMAERAYLPMEVAERLISSVSDSLAVRLQQKYSLERGEDAAEITVHTIAKQVEKTREAATLRLLQQLPKDGETFAMVDQLYADDKLTHSLVLSALCHGHTQFFAAAMARLANIPGANAIKLMKDRGQLGLPALYARSGLPETLLPAVRLVIQGVHALEDHTESFTPGTTDYADRLAAFALEAAQGKTIPKLSYLLALIRQNYVE